MCTENIGCEKSRNTSYRGYNQTQESSFSCERIQNADSASLKKCFPSLAMAYVEYQKWDNIYEAANGFSRGTIFRDLDKPWTVSPFAAGYCKRNGGCK